MSLNGRVIAHTLETHAGAFYAVVLRLKKKPASINVNRVINQQQRDRQEASQIATDLL